MLWIIATGLTTINDKKYKKYRLYPTDTKKREVNGLVAISQSLDADNLIIVTKDEENEIEVEGKTIHVIPLWKWLLNISPK